MRYLLLAIVATAIVAAAIGIVFFGIAPYIDTLIGALK